MTVCIFLPTGVTVAIPIGKVSGVTINCRPLNLIVQCTTLWNVSIHTVIM